MARHFSRPLLAAYLTSSFENHLNVKTLVGLHDRSICLMLHRTFLTKQEFCYQGGFSKHLVSARCLSYLAPIPMAATEYVPRKVHKWQNNMATDCIVASEFVRQFSRSSQTQGRPTKGPLETANSQSHMSSPQNYKRKRSSIGLNGIDYIDDKKKQLQETRLNIKRRVGRIRANLLVQDKKIQDKLLDKRNRNVFVRRLRRPLVVKKENIKTIPNLLTTLRMASAPVLSYLVIHNYYGCALSIFVLAGLTDMLDGYIARNFKDQRTAFGTALDPLADKLLICFLTISLTVCDLIPVPLTILILSRDAGLVIASFYFRYVSLAPPKTLARYFDFSHVTAKIYPSTISKMNTGFQLSFVACTLAAPVFDFVDSPWLQMLMYTTAATTFLSGADYMITWRKRLKFIKND